jgi:hypothetical protein
MTLSYLSVQHKRRRLKKTIRGAVKKKKKDAHCSPFPTQVEHLNWNPVVLVSCGGHSTAAITAKGHLYTWGDNSNGQLGYDFAGGNSTPTLVPTLNNQGLNGKGGEREGVWGGRGERGHGYLYTWATTRTASWGEKEERERRARWGGGGGGGFIVN